MIFGETWTRYGPKINKSYQVPGWGERWENKYRSPWVPLEYSHVISRS